MGTNNLPVSWAWKDVLRAVKPKVRSYQYETWFAPLEVVSTAQGEIILGTRHSHNRDHIRENYLSLLKETVREVAGQNLRVVIVAGDQYSKMEDVEDTLPCSSETQDTLQKEAEAAREVGYASRLLLQATLPHSKPARNEYFFERSNGFLTVKVIADPKHGLPYGTYPRLLLAYITTEAVRTRSPIIEIGTSLRQFLERLKLDCSGGRQGSAPRLREHMRRLFTATVSAECQRAGQWHEIGFRPVEKVSMFWDPKNPEQMATWHSTLHLNQTFFEEITCKPVPLDMAALRILSKNRSPLELDIYEWLVHRLSYLRDSTVIPWKALQAQFGCDYGRLRDFRLKFNKHLKEVQAVYPQANVEVTSKGLLLRLSKTHIPMRLIKGSRLK